MPSVLTSSGSPSRSLDSSSTPRAGGLHPVGPPVDHPQLVHEDFLGRPRLLERRGVDHPQQGRDQELIREDRELPDEVGKLGVRRLPVAKPARVGVVGDDAVMEQVAVHAIEELAKRVDLLLGQLDPVAVAPRSVERPSRDAPPSTWVTPFVREMRNRGRLLHSKPDGFQGKPLPPLAICTMPACFCPISRIFRADWAKDSSS